MFLRHPSFGAICFASVFLFSVAFVGCSDDSSDEPQNPLNPENLIDSGSSSVSDSLGQDTPVLPEEPDTLIFTPDEPAPAEGFAGKMVGFVEKGPFKKGASIKLHIVSDVDLNQTGKFSEGSVVDDFGSFSVDYSGLGIYGLLEAKGEYLNEISGEKGGASLTLNSFVRASDGNAVNVNILTHLEYPRILYLMKEKSIGYGEAQAQAESEILKAFYMKNFNVAAQKMSLFGTEESDGNFLAMSLLMQSVFASAETQAAIDAVAADLEKDGTWDDEQTKTVIADWAYLQKMDEMVYYLDDLRPDSPFPNFDQKFRTFWFRTYGLGVCDSTNQNQLSPNTNPLSKYAGQEFICVDSVWKIASAAVLQNREGTSLFGACTETMEQQMKSSSDGRIFICSKSSWHLASENELLNSEVSAKNGACTSSNDGSVSNMGTYNAVCLGGVWKKLSATPIDYSKGRAMNTRLGPGINLGNAWESKGTKGSSADCGWNNCIRDEYFKIIKDAGFKSVRIPVRWNYDAAQNSPYTLDAGRLAGVKADIDLALAQGLTVIVNFHHYEELNNAAVYHSTNPSFYESEKARFLGLWKQVAKEMDAYDDDKIVLELLNEPHDMEPEDVNDLMISAYKVVRENAPNKTIMFEGNGYSKFAQLTKLDLPADGNIIVSGHYYEPFSFTHQGHGYDCGTKLTSSALSNIPRHFKSYVDSITFHFPDVNGGHVPMNMVEFGVSTCGGNGPSNSDRAKWTDAVIKEADAYGLSWQYWGLVGVGGFEAYNGSWISELLTVFKKYID